MLQTLLAFAIPTVITISAAFFLLRKVQQSEEQQRYPHNENNNYDYDDARRSASARRRRQNNLRDSECAVCFDRKTLVELYPCGHKNFCADCINKIIYKSKRLCPLCRIPIRGYSDQ